MEKGENKSMKIVFTGVVLRSVQRDSTSGKLHFSAELTAAVSKAFDWGALPDTAIGCKMDGELSGGSLVLTPKEMGLRPSELACDFATLGHFEVLRLETENSRGKGHRSEVFALIVRVSQPLQDMKSWHLIRSFQW